MARYIDADKLVDRLKVSPIFQDFNTDGYFIRDMVIDLVGCQPTADVVPKTEVEELSNRYEDLMLKHIDLAKDHDELIAWGGHIKSKDKARIRAEIAREIFEEIEKIAMHGVTSFGLCLMSMGEAAFAELKKKYTEDINHED